MVRHEVITLGLLSANFGECLLRSENRLLKIYFCIARHLLSNFQQSNTCFYFIFFENVWDKPLFYIITWIATTLKYALANGYSVGAIFFLIVKDIFFLISRVNVITLQIL